MVARAPIVKVVKSVDGLEIYAEAAGDPSKPPVVFIHGFSFSGIVWDVQFSSPELLRHIYAVRFDIRGHGRSGKPERPEAWTSQRLAEDFDAVVTAFNLKKPVLAGWSYGAMIAGDVVNAFGPTYLAGIIYIGAMAYTPDESNFLSPQDDPVCAKFQDLNLSPSENRQLLLAFLGGCCEDPEALSAETRQSWFEVMLNQPFAARRQASSRTQDKARFWATAGPVLPVLLIHGQLDIMCPHDAMLDEARARFRKVDIESWAGVGHATFIERSKEFNATVIDWVHKLQ